MYFPDITILLQGADYMKTRNLRETMSKVLGVTIIVCLLVLMSGCMNQAGSEEMNLVQEKKDTVKESGIASSSLGDTHNELGDTKQKTNLSSGTGESDDENRYYYNIKIISPTDLESMQKEIKPDEYLIHNDKGALIGIVSPRSLYIRGDLVQLQRDTGREGRVFDKTDVAEHLIDITFGIDNAKLDLFKTDKDYQIWFDAFYTNDDVDYMLKKVAELNGLSDTTQFEDEEVALGFLKSNYETIPYNYYNIKIVPENMLDDFKDKRTSDEHLIKDDNGKLIGIVGNDHLYLLETLTTQDRQYYMLWGLLYSMGLHGTTYSEQDSFFYRGKNPNKSLSDLDTEAIRLLYGGRLKSGMSMEETKKTLGLES